MRKLLLVLVLLAISSINVILSQRIFIENDDVKPVKRIWSEFISGGYAENKKFSEAIFQILCRATQDYNKTVKKRPQIFKQGD